MFACGVEHGDHVLEVHAGAVKRRHRQGKVRVAGLDGDRQVRQVLEKLHEVGSAGARRQAEVAGLIEDAVHRVGHFGRDVAHLAVLERAGGQVVDVLVVVLGAVEVDRVDEAACVRTVDLAEDLTLLLDGRDVASGHRLDAEVEAVRMGELAEFGVVVRQAVDVGVVAGAEHLSGAEAGAGFEEGLPVDGAGVGLDAENFDVEDLDAGGLQIGFDFTDHGRVADHVVLRFGRGGGHEADADVAVARLGGAEHLIGGRDVENGEGGKADRTRKLQRLVVAVLERDGGDLRRGGVAPETGSGGGTLKEAAAIRKHDVFLLG